MTLTADSERQPSNLRRIVVLWAATRILLSLWVAFCSAFFHASAYEQQFAAWPPRTPVGEWLSRVFLTPWDRWDVVHFLKIASRGYRPDDGTAAFHPLYPVLGNITGTLVGGHELWGMFIVSSLGSLLFLIALERLARLDLPPELAYRACFFFLMLPVAFVLFAPYSESLFMFCSVVAVLMARRDRWWLAGSWGALAVLTRQQGLLLLVPLAWEFWEAAHRDWRTALTRWRAALSLLLIPIALVGWVAFRNLTLAGDVRFEWSDPYSLVYGLFISPSATKVVPQQIFTYPWKAMYMALSYWSITNIIDLTMGAVYIVLLITGAKRLWSVRPSYFLYALVTVLVSLSFSTGLPYSYMGLARHCLLAFPFALLVATSRRRTALWMTVVGLLSMLVLSLLYVWENLWLP